MTYSQVLGIGTWTFLEGEGHYSAHTYFMAASTQVMGNKVMKTHTILPSNDLYTYGVRVCVFQTSVVQERKHDTHILPLG